MYIIFYNKCICFLYFIQIKCKKSQLKTAFLHPIYSYDIKFVIKLRLSYLQNIIYKKN